MRLKFLILSCLGLVILGFGTGMGVLGATTEKPAVAGIAITPTVTPTPTVIQPTERALKTAAYIYAHANKKDKEDLEEKMLTKGSATLTVKMMALQLDADPSKLALAEIEIEKSKEIQAQPQVIYKESAPIYIENPHPAIQPQPVIQNNSPKNCTSNTVGNYTYTNCY